jgi:hypothetical protein
MSKSLRAKAVCSNKFSFTPSLPPAFTHTRSTSDKIHEVQSTVYHIKGTACAVNPPAALTFPFCASYVTICNVLHTALKYTTPILTYVYAHTFQRHLKPFLTKHCDKQVLLGLTTNMTIFNLHRLCSTEWQEITKH